MAILGACLDKEKSDDSRNGQENEITVRGAFDEKGIFILNGVEVEGEKIDW